MNTDQEIKDARIKAKRASEASAIQHMVLEIEQELKRQGLALDIVLDKRDDALVQTSGDIMADGVTVARLRVGMHRTGYDSPRVTAFIKGRHVPSARRTWRGNQGKRSVDGVKLIKTAVRENWFRADTAKETARKAISDDTLMREFHEDRRQVQMELRDLHYKRPSSADTYAAVLRRVPPSDELKAQAEKYFRLVYLEKGLNAKIEKREADINKAHGV